MSDTVLDVQNVSMRFGPVRALEGVSFSAPRGAFVAIIGPNGAGKSTLLQIILGLQAPSEGAVTLFGNPPTKFPARSLGYIPQLKTIDRSFPAKAIELVVTGLRRGWPWYIRKQEREDALAAMALTGVDALADRPIAALSGGELQRVYLARSLVRKPSLVVLDEPTAGMDAMGEADMYHLLARYQQEVDATILMITHDWEGARFHASHALLLDRRLIDFGPSDEIARNERLMRMFGFTGHIETTHHHAHSANSPASSDAATPYGESDVS